ncbi:MAG: hypothetical protein CMO80_09825 [Verrucomicrobiales bacterium]|nr:hypothetical protein [Verrucomicrobiales bacterium]|tara:strand:- start:65 stop:280 length:216 start_codon:yes stop_codon:yes gene_type:complete
MKAGEETIADTCDEVSILFVDIVGFTKHSATVAPQELVKMLNGDLAAFGKPQARAAKEDGISGYQRGTGAK